MATVEECVDLATEHKMLVCRLCNSGVRPGDGIERHFRSHKVKGQLLADIKHSFGAMELSDPACGRLPADGSAPVESMPVLRGYSCRQCRFLTTSRKGVQQHWQRARHDQAGGQRFDSVRLQTWLGGKFARYWTVGGDDKGEQKRVVGESALERMIAECSAELETEDGMRLRKGDAEEGLDRDSAWVKRTGWAPHFGTRDLLAVLEAVEWVRATKAKEQQRRGMDEAAAREQAQLVRLGQSCDDEV